MDKQIVLKRTFYRGGNQNLVKYYENKEIFNLSLGLYCFDEHLKTVDLVSFYYRVFETYYCHMIVGKKQLGLFVKDEKLYLLIYTICVFLRAADLAILNKIYGDLWKIVRIINEFIQTNKYRIIIDFQECKNCKKIVQEIYFVLLRNHFYVEIKLIRSLCLLLLREGLSIQKNFVEHINNERVELVEVSKGHFQHGIRL